MGESKEIYIKYNHYLTVRVDQDRLAKVEDLLPQIAAAYLNKWKKHARTSKRKVSEGIAGEFDLMLTWNTEQGVMRLPLFLVSQTFFSFINRSEWVVKAEPISPALLKMLKYLPKVKVFEILVYFLCPEKLV